MIVICPGHHQGARGAKNAQYNIYEHDVAYRVSGLVVDALRRAGYAVEMVEGRLRQKVQRINTLYASDGVDLALDIHFNADYDHLDPHDYNDARGHGCMVMFNPGMEKREEQASAMSKVMAKVVGSKDHGGRPGWHWKEGERVGKNYFLEKTHCPALIPELCYIDNNGEYERFLSSEDRLHISAMAIVEGVMELMK
jgi:N-acetylmuramoyl-L-alanine amidase